MKAGIQRIEITDQINGRGAGRFRVAQKYHQAINQVYRNIYPLSIGCDYIQCSANEKLARYDIDFGVDVLLNLVNGQTITIQEKVLGTTYSTVTVEYYQNPQTGEEGDWFKLKCDLYFVGYGTTPPRLDRWILLDWNRVKLYHNQIPWWCNSNKKDGARANFLAANFWQIPDVCIIAAEYDYKGSTIKKSSDDWLKPSQYRLAL